MTEPQHMMPIHGCVPNQLQALHDELGKANREIAELRGLLMLAVELQKSFENHAGKLKRDIMAVLAR